jgi:adiponectin receptor
MDYGGVNILTLGSTFPPIVYGFACYPYIMILYLSISTFFCVSSFVITLIPGGDQPAFRKLRGILFVVVGLIAGASPLHSAIAQYFIF